MKTIQFNLKKTILFSFLATLLFFSACKKDRDDMNGTQTIAAMVSGNADFSLLSAALVHANLVTDLQANGPFTVFAPNNAAFVAAGLDTEAKIKNMSSESLRKILLYHVLSARVPSASIAMANNTEVATMAQLNVYVTKNASGVYVNGAMVTNADMKASNGVIHVINKVLMPPTGNIFQTAQANANFSFLAAAIVRASLGSTNVGQVLSGNGPYTVFAPTNQAFINAGFTTLTSIQTSDPALLTKILTYHVIAGRVFSSDLTEGARPATLQSGALTITLTGGAKVKGISNANASNITSVNIVASNGVIHAIDQVLLPAN